MLISVHDKTLSRVTFLDNEKPNTLHYFDDTWHRYLAEATSTFDFSVPKTGNPDLEFLTEKGYISFPYGNKSYLFNIMKVEETEKKLTCYCENLNLELLNETSPEYKAPAAKTFVQYLSLLGIQYAQLQVGINEVSDLSRSLEWTGQDTKLARLLSLVSKFDAECEFATHLNRDGTLDKIVLNVYRKHDDSHQGVGTRRKDVTLYYGKEIKEIRRTVDKTGLYTAIKPIGTDGLNISTLDKTELDEDGNVLFRSPKGDTHILCPALRDEYPSQVVDPTGDRYINLDWTYETKNVNTLYGQALAKLKSVYMPAITYEVDGFIKLEIGDTIKIHDNGFAPLLLLEARVSEQEISFSKPDRNKTTFANFRALENKLSSDIQKRLEALVQAGIPYRGDIITSNGTIFKNGEGTTELTARVTRGTSVITGLKIQWYKDGIELSNDITITINAEYVTEKAVYRFEALDATGDIKCFAEVTLIDVSDGTDGAGRTYLVESSDDIVHCALDGTPTVPYIDFSTFYQEGTDVEKHPYAGRFAIDQTTDGKTWKVAYESREPESTVRYYLQWLFGTETGDAFGTETGDALGSTLTDVIQLRCRFYATNSDQTLVGVKSVAVVRDGDPTGLSESDAPPDNAHEGMLWRYTGAPMGVLRAVEEDTTIYSPGTTYIYRSGEWEVYKFVAENIEADTFKGYQFDGAVFNNEFDILDDIGSRIQGTSQIADGKVKIDSTMTKGSEQHTLSAVLKYNGITIETDKGNPNERYASMTNNNLEFSDYLMSTTLYNNGLAIVAADGSFLSAGSNGLVMVDASQKSSNVSTDTFLPKVVSKGRAISTSTSDTWLLLATVPNYNSNNKYFVLANCLTEAIVPYVRSSDGKVTAYGPNIKSGSSYTVDYVVIQLN